MRLKSYPALIKEEEEKIMVSVSVSVSARYCIPQGGGGVDWVESTTGYTFTHCVGSFTSSGIDTRYKGPTAFSVSSGRHRGIHSLELGFYT